MKAPVVTGGSGAAAPVRSRQAGALAGRVSATWRPRQCLARLVAARDWLAGVSRLGAGRGHQALVSCAPGISAAGTGAVW